MRTTNYSAHIVDKLNQVVPHFSQLSLEGQVLSECLKHLKDSQKFIIPDNGIIIEGMLGRKITMQNMQEKYCTPLRLPFPAVALEVPVTVAEALHIFDASVILAHEQEEEDGSFVIRVLVMIRRPSGSWDILSRGVNLRDNSMSGFPASDDTYRSGEHHGQWVSENMYQFISVLLQFIAASRCSNTMADVAISPPEKLNKKRRKAGKQPFFSYKVLTIGGFSSSASANAGGTHASPRVHLRRGHIRRLPNKTVWVNAAVVGDKSRGMVTKDYCVAPQASHEKV